MEIIQANILVGDHQPLFRHALVSLMREVWPNWRFEEAASFAAVSETLQSGGVTLALLALDLPGMPHTAGIDLARRTDPDCIIAAFGNTEDRATVLQCLTAGARGYICKAATPIQVVRAVQTLLAGGVYAPVSLVGSAAAPCTALPAEPPDDRRAACLSRLTGRQQEIFLLLREGCATKTIARRLDLSVGTVKVHLAALYRTLGAHSRLQAVANANLYPMRFSLPVPGPHTAPVRREAVLVS